MGLPQSVVHLTPDDYLAWENTQAEKHEYVNGEVFAMVGARHEVAPGIRPPWMAEVSKMQEHFFDLPPATLVEPFASLLPARRM